LRWRPRTISACAAWSCTTPSTGRGEGGFAARCEGREDFDGGATIALEDLKAQPGDLVSLYATAKGARTEANTDMFFIQAEPFEKNYSQSRRKRGGGDAGGAAERRSADLEPPEGDHHGDLEPA